MHLRRVGPCTVTVALLATAPALGGQSQERRGFWIGFGGGYGSAKISCAGCGDRQGSYTGFLKLGGTLSPRFLLGIEANVWVKDQEDVTFTVGNGSGTLTFCPQASAGFFLKGGGGFSIFTTEFREASGFVRTDTIGWGFLAGLGYDLRVGRKLSITPSFNYFYGKPGGPYGLGETPPSLTQDVLDFAIGITFH